MSVSSQLKQVISGGQTGVDQLGLEVARSLGIATGGIVPKGYQTETGPNESLRAYGLVEHISTKYPPRTKANIRQSDGTVLFGDATRGGTKLTLEICKQESKPYLVNPTAEELRQWLLVYRIAILNVAGSRASQLTAEQLESYRQVLMNALTYSLL